MRIAILIEGDTERAFLPILRAFLQPLLSGKMPKLDSVIYNGRIPKSSKLEREVARLLSDGKQSADIVIALTDVYTGTDDFSDANDAKSKMRQWVGSEERFYPHAAQYDFEAWLLPYWNEIQRIAGSDRKPPGADPEKVNHSKPPVESTKGDLPRRKSAGNMLRRVMRHAFCAIRIYASPLMPVPS